jgi:hypothetical protein
MEELDPASNTAGTIADHLHRGRHRQRRADQDALLADERYQQPEPDDDPYFRPYPQPQPQPMFTETVPLQQVRTSWPDQEGHWR